MRACSARPPWWRSVNMPRRSPPACPAAPTACCGWTRARAALAAMRLRCNAWACRPDYVQALRRRGRCAARRRAAAGAAGLVLPRRRLDRPRGLGAARAGRPPGVQLRRRHRGRHGRAPGQRLAAARRRRPRAGRAGRRSSCSPMPRCRAAAGAAARHTAGRWRTAAARSRRLRHRRRRPALRLPLAGDGYALPLPVAACCAAPRTTRANRWRRHARREPPTTASTCERLQRLTGLQPPPGGSRCQGRVGWRAAQRRPAADRRRRAAARVRHATGQRLDQARLAAAASRACSC